MLFSELRVGCWFRLGNDIEEFRYMKIIPIEDKWGNLVVAVDFFGDTYDSEHFKPNLEVEPG